MIEKIQFSSEGEKVKGTLVTPDPDEMQNKYPAVIFLHGATSSERGYLPIAEKLAELGIVGLTINLRGHQNRGRDLGRYNFLNAIADGLSAYDFLVGKDFVDPERIGICGASLGGSVAAIVSEQRPVESLVLRSPATYTDEMMSMSIADLKADEENIFHNIDNIKDTSPLKAMSQFKGDLLVVRSEDDTIIPARIPLAFLEVSNQANSVGDIEIEGATHNLSEESWRAKFIDETVEWFRQGI